MNNLILIYLVGGHSRVHVAALELITGVNMT